MPINSLQNERVKQLVKLRDDRRQRQREHLMLVEGHAEIQLALTAGHAARTFFTCPDLATGTRLDTGSSEVVSVSPPVFKKISYRENPDGWLAIFPLPERKLSDLRWGRAPLALVAQSVEKPGNLGAILRTADAAAVDALLVSDPRVDLFGPNVVRASRGTVFSVPVFQDTSQAISEALKAKGMKILAATPAANQIYTEVDLRGPLAIAVGTEDVGLSHFWLAHADLKVRIPMLGKVNSLNVSIAAALLLYEALRQRSH